MSKPLHILIITSWYPSILDLTYGSFIEEQALLLNKKGHKVTVLQSELTGTFLNSIGKASRFVKTEVHNGLKIIRVKTTPVLPKARTLSYKKLCKFSKKALINQLNNDKPDIIHSHSMFMGGIVGMYLSAEFNIPQIHTEHTSGLIFSPKQYSQSDIKILKRCYEKSENVLVVSNWFKQNLKARYDLKEDKLNVLHNLVDNKFFEVKLSKLGEVKKVLIIGNFIPVKQHILLLNAWKLVLTEFPNLILSFVGNGPLKSTLQKLSSELEISNSIQWLPRQDRNGVLNLIEQHDLLVSSSKLETFGLTVAEALACGTPVVVTDSGGVRDIVTSKDGYITNQNAEDLAEGILAMIKNCSNFDPKEIRRRSKKRFHEDVIYQRLIGIYRDVVTNHKG